MSPSPMPLATATTIGAAGHAAAREIVTGPMQPATPLAATRAAVILAVPGARPISVVSCDAVRLPGSLVLGSPSARLRLADYGPGTRAEVGEGMVRVGDLVVRPTRWWSTHPVPAARRLEVLDAGGLALEELLAADDPGANWAAARLREPSNHFAGALTAAVVTALAAPHRRSSVQAATSAVDAATDLLGLGPGLTPSGDDVVAGALVTVRRLLPDTGPIIASLSQKVAEQALARTTAVSAALLAWAALGEAAPELVGLLGALSRGADLRPGFLALSQVGHTSGRDLALGVVTGTTVVRGLMGAAAGRAVNA